MDPVGAGTEDFSVAIAACIKHCSECGSELSMRQPILCMRGHSVRWTADGAADHVVPYRVAVHIIGSICNDLAFNGRLR